MRTLIKAGVLVLALNSTALADHWQPRQTQQYRDDRHVVAAPELDMDQLLKGVALLASLLVLVRKRA